MAKASKGYSLLLGATLRRHRTRRDWLRWQILRKEKNTAVLEPQHPPPSRSCLPHSLETCSRTDALIQRDCFLLSCQSSRFLPSPLSPPFPSFPSASTIQVVLVAFHMGCPKVQQSSYQQHWALPVGPFSPFHFVGIFQSGFTLSCHLLNGSWGFQVHQRYLKAMYPCMYHIQPCIPICTIFSHVSPVSGSVASARDCSLGKIITQQTVTPKQTNLLSSLSYCTQVPWYNPCGIAETVLHPHVGESLGVSQTVLTILHLKKGRWCPSGCSSLADRPRHLADLHELLSHLGKGYCSFPFLQFLMTLSHLVFANMGQV